jgi:hypothetical protein
MLIGASLFGVFCWFWPVRARPSASHPESGNSRQAILTAESFNPAEQHTVLCLMRAGRIGVREAGR